MEWISDFAGKRGGGVVFIDGQRENLRGLEGNAAWAKCCRWSGSTPGFAEGSRSEKDMPEKIELTPAGRANRRVRFVTASLENEEIWARLPAPHWAAPVRELPGSEVLARAVIDGTRSYPTLVTRRYGAGPCLLLRGFDEAWRWRYNVGDRYHQKYWVQVTNWVSERPFAIEGKYLSLAADRLVYDPGKRADLRVRVRDEGGQPVEDGEYVAIIYKGLESSGGNWPGARCERGRSFPGAHRRAGAGRVRGRGAGEGVPWKAARVYGAHPVRRAQHERAGAGQPLRSTRELLRRCRRGIREASISTRTRHGIWPIFSNRSTGRRSFPRRRSSGRVTGGSCR